MKRIMIALSLALGLSACNSDPQGNSADPPISYFDNKANPDS